jgi:hypothetical protein
VGKIETWSGRREEDSLYAALLRLTEKLLSVLVVMQSPLPSSSKLFPSTKSGSAYEDPRPEEPRPDAQARFHPAQRLYCRRLHAGQN